MDLLGALDLGTVVAAVPVIGVLVWMLGRETVRADREREQNDELEKVIRATLRDIAGMASEDAGNGAK